MVKKSFLFIMTAAIFAFFHPVTSHAGADDTPPPPPPANKTEAPKEQHAFPEKMPGIPVAILPSYAYYLSFLQNPQNSESDFTMRLSAFGRVSGCAHLQKGMPPKTLGHRKNMKDAASVKYIGKRAGITISMPEIVLDDTDPRYTNYDCKINHLGPFVDIPLNRDDLVKKGVKEMSFKTPQTHLGKYNITVTQNYVTFKDRIDDDVQTQWLTLWFFPKNTIKLYAPGAKTGSKDLIRKIRDFGLAHGLTPMDEVLDGYTLPPQAHDYVYFVDNRGIFTPSLNMQDNDAIVGNIALSKTYYGPNGPQEQETASPIHASLVLEQHVVQ